jgi:RNA polymerase sigma-70 factor, ECF subfamily
MAGETLDHTGRDEELMMRVQQGDKNAMSEIYALYQVKIFRFVLSLVSDKELASDITMQTFLRVIEKAHTYKPMGCFHSWLYRIARNLSTDENRKRRAHPTIEIDAMTESPEGHPALVVEEGISPQVEYDLRSKLERLSADQRDVMVLMFVHGFSIKQVASHLGIQVNAVKGRQFRAIQNLQDLMNY